MSAGRQSVAVLLLLVAATAVLTWPLLPRLGTAVSDPGDPLLHAWILAWDLHALATRPLG
ncbi:MAG: hypothetical protein HY359_03505, partial [Candidatus Rokubacteria bacterium]|nr:hypothetical protein [Candidatus Rokubacteria bacterium]